MNRALKLTVLVREGALLTNVAQALADATRGGMAMVLVDCSDPADDEARAMAEQIRARNGRCIVASVAEDLEHGLMAVYDGAPPEDQLVQWGLSELLPSADDADGINEGSTEDAETTASADVIAQLEASSASAEAFTASAVADDTTTSDTTAPE